MIASEARPNNDRTGDCMKLRQLSYIHEVARRGVAYDLEMQILTRSGRRIWVRTLGNAVRNHEGVISRVGGDLTVTDEGGTPRFKLPR